MSYCRHDGITSDVYLYYDDRVGRLCMGCMLLDDCGASVLCHDAQQAINHLKLHREVGHKVPSRAFTRLREEAKIEKIERDRVLKELKSWSKKVHVKHKTRMKKSKPMWDKLMKKIENSPINKQDK